MKICFVLPKFTYNPIGGYKIVFEYANRLVKDDHDVDILFLNDNAFSRFPVPQKIKFFAANIMTKIEPRWFELRPEIHKISSVNLRALRKAKNYDVVFATGIQTVEFVRNNFNESRKFNFIQGYEVWGGSEEYLWETYNYGFTNIVVSTWLQELVDRHAKAKTLLLKNPIDTNIYVRKISQTHRKKFSVGLLYHREKIKGFKYAWEAITVLKKKYPELVVEMFGTFREPDNLPNWVHYTKNATQKETVSIYNSVQVFLCASIEEGFGLTGLEAMACGACLVSTSYKSVLDYAQDGYNSILVPIKDVDAMVFAVSKVFDNEKERERLSCNGINSAKEFSWEKAMETFYSYII